MDRRQQYLEELAGRHPELVDSIQLLNELYDKKLWHQLTCELEKVQSAPAWQKENLWLSLYQKFISGFAHRINLLKLALFAVAASRQLSSLEESVSFLGDVITGLETARLEDAPPSILLLRMEQAMRQLEGGQESEASAAAASGQRELESLTLPDPEVSASVWRLSTSLAKAKRDYARFYRSALHLLSFERPDQRSESQRLALGVDLALAALLGQDVYSFGALLDHPILLALERDPASLWLVRLLRAFGAGDMAAYDELCRAHAAVLNAQPALVQNERRLREKITILALVELLHALPPRERTVPLDLIGEKSRLPRDGVEFLLIKALSLGLIRGEIDGVRGVVNVTWVKPRVLTLAQVGDLAARLDAWVAKVDLAAEQFEAKAKGVLVHG
ncbi:hypothetical protein H632_c1094p1 [Helicosporidium sp. ATCC 50920]|nr:hypothetical protein H632_c1094p1 [Helicosporidium sp. ATCC 50920]|eukprot:KDD74756.1 hypothetical protein H632_c1094p1 [Helicosporidium sp. ATCC 50920]